MRNICRRGAGSFSFNNSSGAIAGRYYGVHFRFGRIPRNRSVQFRLSDLLSFSAIIDAGAVTSLSLGTAYLRSTNSDTSAEDLIITGPGATPEARDRSALQPGNSGAMGSKAACVSVHATIRPDASWLPVSRMPSVSYRIGKASTCNFARIRAIWKVFIDSSHFNADTSSLPRPLFRWRCFGCVLQPFYPRSGPPGRRICLHRNGPPGVADF